MEFPIEQKEGETLDQAILRLASGLAEANDKAVLNEPKPKPEKKVTVSDPNAGEPVQNDVHSAIHVYQRVQENGDVEPEGMVRSFGTRYRQMNGPNTLVFVHMHPFGEACSPACRERVAK